MLYSGADNVSVNTINKIISRAAMAKSHDARKNVKKKPQKTHKERRLEKIAKKAGK